MAGTTLEHFSSLALPTPAGIRHPSHHTAGRSTSRRTRSVDLPAPTGNYPQYGLMVRGPRRPQGSAVAVEAILALFGIYGVGWLMSGLTTAGAVIMSLGFVWDVAIVIVAIATLGIGALCLVPMHFLFVTLTTVMLSNQIITD